MTTLPTFLPTATPTSPEEAIDAALEDADDCGISPTCLVDQGKDKLVGAVSEPIGAVIDEALKGIADTITDSVAWFVAKTLTWWVDTPGLDVAEQTSSIEQIRGFLLPLAVAVLVGGVMVQGIRMSLLRRADPAIRAARGLLTFALVSGAGTTAVVTAIEAGDTFSTWVLDNSTGGQFGRRMTDVLTLSLINPGIGPEIVLGLLALASALIQAVLLMFREAALVILTGTLVLAAAGKVASATEGWFPRVTGWCLAMIAYKPTVALVYASSFTMIGEGENEQAVFVGFAAIVLSIIAIAPLMRLFSWATGEVGSGGGGAGSLLMNAGFALQALGGMRGGKGGGGWSPAEHAQHLAQNGPTGSDSDGGRQRGPVPPPPGFRQDGQQPHDGRSHNAGQPSNGAQGEAGGKGGR